jgi:hypothetical protein
LHFPQSNLLYLSDTAPSSDRDVLDFFLPAVADALDHISTRWSQILLFFEELLNEKATILDPDRHDSLLLDDESFSRSKKLFWAINTLKELEFHLRKNIAQLDCIIDMQALANVEEGEGATLEASRSRLKLHRRALKEVATNFRAKRQEAIDLRDGVSS